MGKRNTSCWLHTPNSCRLPPHVIDESLTDLEDDEKSDIDISDDEDEIETEDHDNLWVDWQHFIYVVPKSLHEL